MTRLACLALLPLVFACGGSETAADAGPADAMVPGGTITLAWTVEDPDGAALSCDDVAGTSITVSGEPLDTIVGFSEVFTCGTGTGTSSPIAAGRYDLTIDLKTTGGATLIDERVSLPGVTVTSGGDVSAGTAAFVVDPVGDLGFTIDAEGDGANCGAVDAGGGGIVGLTIELADGTGTCLDGVEIAVGAGGGADGTYITDCDTPLVFGCIENDQTLSMTGRRSGSHTLTVTGQKEGPIDCYVGESGFKIPGNGLAIDLGALALDLSASVDCAPPADP